MDDESDLTVKRQEEEKITEAPEILPSGNDPAMLREISGWNWGACALTWIWLLAFNMPQWAMVVIAGSCTIPFAAVIVSIILGIKGNELAWL